MKTLQTQCDLEQTNSFFQVFYSYFVDQSCEPFIQSSDYREALSFCTTRSVFGLHHRRIFRNRFRSISEEEWTAAQTFLLSHTLLKLKVLHNTTSLIKYPNINPAYDQMFKPKKTQLLQSWSIHDHPSSEQTVWKEFLLHLQLEHFTFSLTGLANFYTSRQERCTSTDFHWHFWPRRLKPHPSTFPSSVLLRQVEPSGTRDGPKNHICFFSLQFLSMCPDILSDICSVWTSSCLFCATEVVFSHCWRIFSFKLWKTVFKNPLPLDYGALSALFFFESADGRKRI